MGVRELQTTGSRSRQMLRLFKLATGRNADLGRHECSVLRVPGEFTRWNVQLLDYFSALVPGDRFEHLAGSTGSRLRRISGDSSD